MNYKGIIQKKILFTDYFNIPAGDISWMDPFGKSVDYKNVQRDICSLHVQDYAIPKGIAIKVNIATKSEPFIIGSTDCYLCINSLIHEGGLYRGWYYSADHAFYAESKDGFNWYRPSFKKYEIDGSNENNAVFGLSSTNGQKFIQGLGVFYDPNGKSNEKYKMIYTAYPPEEDKPALWKDFHETNRLYQNSNIADGFLTCIYGAVSEDGIDWKPIKHPLLIHYGDTLNTINYDMIIKKYVLYTRDYPRGRRIISRAESEDFYNWGPVMPLIVPETSGSPSQDIYTNGFTEYPGEPGIKLMFPMFYERYNQTSLVKMYSSHEGLIWNEVPGGPILSPGLPGEWDSEYICPGTGLVPIGQEKIGFLYCGSDYPHKFPRWKHVLQSMQKNAWAWWPEGRLSCVYAEREGSFCTFPLMPCGRNLCINYRTLKSGFIKIGIEAVKSRGTNECDILEGNELRRIVTWNGSADIGVTDNEAVILHVEMRSAELYSLEWI